MDSHRASALALVLLWPLACTSLVRPLGDVNLLSIEQEREVAAEFARRVESEQRIVRDVAVATYVSDLGWRLANTLRDPEFSYRTRAIVDPSVNAFNIGGGYVYVHTGLIETADTEGQVASVVAHEIGHQVRRHVAKAISRDQLFRTLLSVAVGPNASEWAQLAAGLGITTGQLHFGREAEREADEVMVVLMVRAGYDPNQALAMFEKLRAIDAREPRKVATIFSSHPPTSERMETVGRSIASLALAPGLVRDSRRFQEIRRRLPRG